jgi:hypothetical protein
MKQLIKTTYQISRSADQKIGEEVKRLINEEKKNHSPLYHITNSPILLLYCSTALFFCFIFLSSANAFDIKGIQPLSPYGVFSTFSAESLKQNQVGFSLNIEKSVEPNFYRTNLNFAYGIHDRVEFNLTVPYVFEWEDKIDGFEDVSIAIKHRLFDEKSYSPAIAYLLFVSTPNGRDEFTSDGSVGVGLILTKKVGPFKGHLNVLYSRPGMSELKSDYSLNLGTELAISHSSKILAEIVGKKNYFKNKIDLLEWRLGYRVATTDNIFTSVGLGFDFKNRSPDYRLMFSISFIFPSNKTK